MIKKVTVVIDGRNPPLTYAVPAIPHSRPNGAPLLIGVKSERVTRGTC